MLYNRHQFKKYYKISQEVVDFLRAYVTIFGVTVAITLESAVYMRFGIRLSCHWITVILKSAQIPRANRGSRRRRKEEDLECKVQTVIEYQDKYAGLILFESLFMSGPGRVIANNLPRRNAYKFVADLGKILISGRVKRPSQYECGAIEGVEICGQSLANAINNLANITDLCQNMLVAILEYWVKSEIPISRLYTDGHSKIFYTKRKSLCGKISCGGVAPGTRMVYVCQQDGIILWLQMHRIDEHLGKPFIEDTVEVLNHLPDVANQIPLVADREISGKKLSEYSSEEGVPLLTMLRPGSYKGMEDFVGDLEHPGLHKWANTNKSDDSRRFYILENRKRLIVFSVNFDDQESIDMLSKWYKDRWNANENPLRTVNQLLNNNVNTGQSVRWIDNPKQIKTRQEADIQLPKLKERYKKESKKIPRKTHTIVAKANKLTKISKLIQKQEKILHKPIQKVAVKNAEADHFMSIFKANILNMVMSLLMTIKWPTCNSQEAGFFIKSIFQREGIVKKQSNQVEILLKPMWIKVQREKQQEFVKRINNMNFLTKDGKLIKLSLLERNKKKRKKIKNLSSG